MPPKTRWEDIFPTVTASDGTWTTTTTAGTYIWTTTSTPVSTSGSGDEFTWVYTSPVPSISYDFPEFETYNFESPKGRESYVTALNTYLNFYFTKNPK